MKRSVLTPSEGAAPHAFLKHIPHIKPRTSTAASAGPRSPPRPLSSPRPTQRRRGHGGPHRARGDRGAALTRRRRKAASAANSAAASGRESAIARGGTARRKRPPGQRGWEPPAPPSGRGPSRPALRFLPGHKAAAHPGRQPRRHGDSFQVSSGPGGRCPPPHCAALGCPTRSSFPVAGCSLPPPEG